MTELELETLKDQVLRVIEYSQDNRYEVYDNSVNEIIHTWYNNKRYFIQEFGETLIREFPNTTFHLGIDEKRNLFYQFSSIVEDYVNRYNILPGLAWFVEMNQTGFFENRVVKEYVFPDGTKIAEGMKFVKALKFFVPDEDVLKRLQTDASMIIQKDKIEGTLCFSVHPLDYLSVSENNHGWRSCHALDGEYRAGNLSYMMDESTIVCYLKSATGNVKIPRFPEDIPWNDKKWRVLLYISQSQNSMFLGRQYPFTADGALDVLRDFLPLIFSDIKNRYWSDWSNEQWKSVTNSSGDEVYLSDRFVVFNSIVLPFRYLFKEPKERLHYNDLIRSSYYVPYYRHRTGPFYINFEDEAYKIGHNVPCLCCNGTDITNQENGTFLCGSCYGEYEGDQEERCSCYLCGSSEWVDNMWTYRNSWYICESCYENDCEMCQHCSWVDVREDMYYDELEDDYYCSECYAHLLKERERHGSEGNNK